MGENDMLGHGSRPGRRTPAPAEPAPATPPAATAETPASTVPDARRGLTSAEAASRAAAGQANARTPVRTKSVRRIVADHTLTLFNGVNAVLALLVLTTGAYRNMLFMGVVLTNLVVGIWQEVRAKRQVDRLTLITASDARVRRDGVATSVPVDQVVLGDVVLLSHGEQAPADGEVVYGQASMNESLLTGESAAVPKRPGSQVLSGSFVDSGSLEYRVTKVGADGYAASIEGEVKRGRLVASEIQETLSAIIRLSTYLMGPIGACLFLRLILSEGGSYQAAVLQTVAALVGMIPQGLVLLTSGVLAIATTRLAHRQVLVQQSYCVETLARVDVLCLDKTGTITTGRMRVSSVRPAPGHDAAEVECAAATVVGANADDANETARAIMAHCAAAGAPASPTTRAVPFSSATKLSGCVTQAGQALVLGAAQFVLGPTWREAAPGLSSYGELERVLVVAQVDGFDEAGVPQGTPRLLGYVALCDEIRPSAAQTIAYFREQGVQVRVISGDDPRTASAMARAVGVEGAERTCDASALSPADLPQAVRDCVVFGRVTPQLKRDLVRELRAQGHVVAMTGDGVNDVLALREADCSVAMASGTAAARNISDVVLVDDDFAHMPEVVAEGRRSINNLERSASLFLVKTVYSAVLAIIATLIPPYPFIPIQMTLISGAVIGWPSFVLALEPNHERVRGSFVVNVFSKSLPASGSIVCGLLVAMVVARVLGWPDGLLSTVCMLVLAAVGAMLIFRVSQPLDLLRAALLASVVALVLVGVFVFGDFFQVASMTLQSVVVCGALVVLSLLLFNRLYDWSQAYVAEPGNVERVLKRVEALNGGKVRI